MQKAVHPDGAISPPPGGVLYKGKNRAMPTHLTRRRHRRKSYACNRGRCCMTSLCSTIITLVVLIGIGILVFWLYVRPKSPQYTFGNARITGLEPASVAAATTIGTLNATTSFTLEARNPNKRIGYRYEKIDVKVVILGVQIANGEIPPFYQGHENTTFLVEEFKSGALNVLELTQAGVLKANQAGSVPVDFKVDAKARVKIGKWKSPKFKIAVRCSATVNTTGTAKIGAPGKKCSHKIKFWIF